MRSFRVRRQGTQRGEEEDVWGIDAPLTPAIFDEGSHSPAALSLDERNGMRLGESVTNITTPKAEDRELSGGRLVNEEAIYNMRKRWISERLHERYGRMTAVCEVLSTWSCLIYIYTSTACVIQISSESRETGRMKRNHSHFASKSIISAS